MAVQIKFHIIPLVQYSTNSCLISFSIKRIVLPNIVYAYSATAKLLRGSYLINMESYEKAHLHSITHRDYFGFMRTYG